MTFFRETIYRESEHALFVLAQVLNANARDAIKPQMSGRLIARLAVDEFIVAADKDRIAESEDADRGSDLTKMGRIERADLSRRRPKISERT